MLNKLFITNDLVFEYPAYVAYVFKGRQTWYPEHYFIPEQNINSIW